MSNVNILIRVSSASEGGPARRSSALRVRLFRLARSPACCRAPYPLGLLEAAVELAYVLRVGVHARYAVLGDGLHVGQDGRRQMRHRLLQARLRQPAAPIDVNHESRVLQSRSFSSKLVGTAISEVAALSSVRVSHFCDLLIAGMLP